VRLPPWLAPRPAATDIVFLDPVRAVQGIGAGVMFAVSLAILANAFPEARERAGALAAYGTTIGRTFALGPARSSPAWAAACSTRRSPRSRSARRRPSRAACSSAPRPSAPRMTAELVPEAA
jgi:hypothetical protein